MGLEMPESNDLPSSLVTVCGALVILVHVTVVPTLMVMAAGLNAKVLLDMIETAIVLPDGAVVGVLPDGAVVGVVPPAVGVVPVLVVPPPPQAASSTSAANASKTNHRRL